MSEVKIVGRGVDTLVLNVCYADERFQPIKCELAEDLQNELDPLQNAARLNEAPVLTHWAFTGNQSLHTRKGIAWTMALDTQVPFLSVAISRSRLSRIIAQVRLPSEYLWSGEYLAEAIVAVGMFLYSMFGDYLWFQVSEVDLCANVVGWHITAYLCYD